MTIEAEFTVGEYEVVILSTEESTGLDTWLREEKYALPAGAEPLLRPYVEGCVDIGVDAERSVCDPTTRSVADPARRLAANSSRRPPGPEPQADARPPQAR